MLNKQCNWNADGRMVKGIKQWKENLLGLLNARGVVDNQLRKCRKEVVVN